MRPEWICCYIPFLILILLLGRREKTLRGITRMHTIKKNGGKQMQELAKRLIEKDVYMKMVDGSVEDGILTEVTDNAVVLEKDEKTRFVNLDYVVHLMEYPKNSKGKRKGLILD